MDPNLANNAEPHEVLIVRERAAFPLRLLTNLAKYRYAYDLARQQGASANPIHTRKDVREWLRIDPPGVEEQRDAWKLFVVAWALGIVTENVDTQLTAVGQRARFTYSASYVDNYGLPKTDVLGERDDVEEPDPTASDANPPRAMRNIVLRLCDDRNLKAHIERAINLKLRADGVQAVGDALIRHLQGLNAKKVKFYDHCHLVVAGRPEANVPIVGYLQQIGYDGPAGSASQAPAPVAESAAAAPASASGNRASAPVVERLQKLKELLDGGLITAEDFEKRKGEILAEV
jgi:hypothetical protein